jgi:hypothetical protein
MVSARHYSVVLLIAASLCPGLRAQESCNSEAKLLLASSQVQAATTSLYGTEESHGRIYFYDTSALDLLSKGLILRLRKGADSDLTVKMRPPNGKHFSDPSVGKERYKCEVEITGGVESRSYSVQADYVAGYVPEKGTDLLPLLSPGQKRLLENSQIRIDWAKVKQVADIQSTTWKGRARKSSLGKLSLELWKWPNGRILEVSTKTAPNAGPAAYTELESLAKKNGLALSPVQQSKTATVLKEMNAVRAH